MGNRKIREWKERLLNLIYPHVCPFCGAVTTKEVCDACSRKLKWVHEPRCKRCGKPIRYAEKEYCNDCVQVHHYYDRGLSLWLHKPPVTWSLYQFKYHNKRVFGEYYAKELVEKYRKQIISWNVQMMIPVPLHKSRYRKRGYNQAEIIATHLSDILEIPMDISLVQRVENTKPQKEFNNKERSKNLENAFALQRRKRYPRRVLIVDDIYTTGSTIDAIAKLLKKAGVEKVYFLTVSIGQGV